MISDIVLYNKSDSRTIPDPRSHSDRRRDNILSFEGGESLLFPSFLFLLFFSFIDYFVPRRTNRQFRTEQLDLISFECRKIRIQSR